MAELGDHGAASSTDSSSISTSLFTSGSVVGRLQTPGTTKGDAKLVRQACIGHCVAMHGTRTWCGTLL